MEIHKGALAQGYAVSIEHILCKVFDCERFGYGGIVNSDFIRKQPFTAMACGFSFIYATAKSDKQKEIIEFINDYSFFSEMSIDTLLSFETSTKDINGITIGINYKNGQEAVENMIDDYRKLCKN